MNYVRQNITDRFTPTRTYVCPSFDVDFCYFFNIFTPHTVQNTPIFLWLSLEAYILRPFIGTIYRFLTPQNKIGGKIAKSYNVHRKNGQ